jgi:cytochrome c-type protein NapC
LLAAAASAAILISFLVRKPALNLSMKLWLLIGIGALPTLSAGTSTVAGMEATTNREFCGSCHVMTGHYLDSSDPTSHSLAARHSRNPFFGERACYVCHADYGMYGYPVTKAGGLRHVYLYYFGGYHKLTLSEAEREIHLVKPYDNRNCRQCHTTTGQDWRSVPDHESLRAELDSNRVSCASAGCHGFAHPFTKPAKAGAAPAASASTSGSASGSGVPSAPSAPSGAAL